MIASCAGSARAGCQYDSEISLKSRAVNILFIHQNFPGQFVHLSAELAKDKRNKVVALSIYKLPAPAGVMVRHYTMLRPAAPETHPLLQDQEAKVLRAEACAAAALQLKREGFVPDLIVAHPGWGEALFMKDVFPQARLVIYCEYYYALEGQDVGFDPEIPPLNFQQRCRLRLKNTTNLLSMEIADAAISPTLWQKSTFPAWAQDKITVIHDGIDTTRLQPNPHAELTLAATSEHGAVHIKAGDEVLTYVARNLEPVRGFHVFMRILPEVLRRRPKALAIVVGGDGVGYGHSAPNGKTWKEHMLAEVGRSARPVARALCGTGAVRGLPASAAGQPHTRLLDNAFCAVVVVFGRGAERPAGGGLRHSASAGIRAALRCKYRGVFRRRRI
jgi:glycosyltransferase involved in cell wall biosynthesis